MRDDFNLLTHLVSAYLTKNKKKLNELSIEERVRACGLIDVGFGQYAYPDNPEKVVAILVESKASEEAHKRGLEYAGWGGQWKDPSTGKVVAKSVDGGARLVAISPKEAEGGEKDQGEETGEKEKRDIVGGKDKTLKEVDTTKTEAFTEPIRPSEKAWRAQNSKNKLVDKYIKLPSWTRAGKFPPRYVDALERMLNTRFSNKTRKWSYYSSVPGGAGDIRAQAGELMTLMATTMTDEEAEEFFGTIAAYIEYQEQQLTRGKTMTALQRRAAVSKHQTVDMSWLEAARSSRDTILRRARHEYGEEVEIINGAWDTKREVTALGLEDYYKNKGYSTDVYFKVRTPDGRIVLDEVSLKKDLFVNLLNSGVGNFKDWYKKFGAGKELPSSLDSVIFAEKRLKRYQNYLTSNSTHVRKFLRSLKPSDPLYAAIRRRLPGKPTPAQLAKELESFITPKRGPNRGHRKIMMEIIARMGEGRARSGYVQEANKILETDNRERKKFENRTTRALAEDPIIKEGVLYDIRGNLPLKSVAEGEETIALDGESLDPTVMREIFGTSNFDVIKERLVVKTPKNAAPYVAYEAGPEELIPIATIVIREDGVGYGSQFKLEMQLDSRFRGVVKKANRKIYPREGK